MAEFRDPRHGPTIRGDDQIARPQPRLRRRGSRPTCGDPGLAGERIPRAVPDAQHTRRQRLPIFQSRQHAEHVLERHCEADARVVEFRTQIHARGVGRQRGENADGTAPDVDEWSAIVGRRDRGIGLHGAAPRPIRGGQDADGNTGNGAVPGTPHRDRPLAHRQFGPRRPLGDRRWRLIDPQQDEPAGQIASHDPRHPTLTARRRRQHDDRLTGILRHGKRRGENPAPFLHDNARRGTAGRSDLR